MGPSEIHERRLAETLFGVARAIAKRDDLREIVQAVTDETTAITGAQFGAFFYNVVGRDGESYSLYTISGVPRERFERFPMPRNSDIFRPTFEGSATVRLDDVTLDPRYGRSAPYYGMPPGHLPVRSYLAASVLGRDGNVVGGLFVGHEAAGVFTAEHERVAEQIATQAGLAIEQAQLLATERAARAEAEARADAAIALEAVDDGIAMVDDQGVIRLWNPAAERITGLRAGSVLGRPIGQAVAGWERIALRVPVGERSGATTPATLPLDTVTGYERWLSLYGIAVDSGTVYSFRDVTGQRELDALRADVVATVSHELRTPIAAVYGAAQTLRGHDLDAATSQRLLEVIGSESDRLATLVEEILLTSQIDSGGLTVARSGIDPEQAVAAALTGRDPSSVVVDVSPDAPLACGDPEKVRQILANLIENAFKYGRPPVTVCVREARGGVRFEVSDDGGGIPRHEQHKIFEKFYRLETHVRAGVRGTGLGLYICRELIRRMDGQIGVDSTDGRGSTFWIALPRLEAQG